MTDSMAVTCEEADERAAKAAEMSIADRCVARVLNEVLFASGRMPFSCDNSTREDASAAHTMTWLRGALASTGWLSESEDNAPTERGAALLDRARKAGVL